MEEILRKAKALRHELHKIPEPALKETRTKKCLMKFLANETRLEIIDRGSWFYAKWDGKAKRRPIAFRADFDAVEGADGCMGHFCGHDGHSASLCAFALLLEKIQPARTVYLIFQPAEETGEGAKVCASLIGEADIEEIYAYHNIPGFERGKVLLRYGTFACASTGLEIGMKGAPSHAAYPENGKNPAHALAALVIYMEEVLKKPSEGMLLGTVIGMELGSKAYGLSASKGILRLTLRGEKEEEFRAFVYEIEERAQGLAREEGLELEMKRIEPFPATENHEWQVGELEETARAAGLSTEVVKEPFRWSEDFGYYLQETAGAMIGIGAGVTHPGLHTKDYEFPDEIIETVLKLYEEMVE